MPRHEPLGRPTPGEVLEGETVKLRRDANGKLVGVAPPRKTTETTEAKPDPRDAPDPRPANVRNIPPYGAGI
jgi:hypothetical protein